MIFKISALLTIALAVGNLTAASNISIVPFIVNGTISEKGQFPYFVRIEAVHNDNLKTQCGGSIISKNSIITVADCVDGEHEKINVYFGIVAENVYESSGITGDDKKAILYSANLAILKTYNLIEFSDNVQPIALPDIFMTRENLMDQEVLIAGLGYYQKDEPSQLMRYANMRVFSLPELIENDKCTKYWVEKEICLKSDDNFMMAYTGDSGDPVIFEVSGKPYLVGVINRVLDGKYNTAISIHPYIFWIDYASDMNRYD